MIETELLAVLDMSEDEQQIKALYSLGYTEYFVRLSCGRDGEKYECRKGTLADLAFRLRDEVEQKIGLWWSGAISKVFFYIAHTPERFDLSTEDRARQFNWFGTKAKPIHWVIASLIAKGKVINRSLNSKGERR